MDELDQLAASLEILDFHLIQALAGDCRLSVDLHKRAKDLYKGMYDHLFAGNPSKWYDAEHIMEQVKALELEANLYLLQSDQITLNEGLTSPNSAMRKAAQQYYNSNK